MEAEIAVDLDREGAVMARLTAEAAVTLALAEVAALACLAKTAVASTEDGKDCLRIYILYTILCNVNFRLRAGCK